MRAMFLLPALMTGLCAGAASAQDVPGTSPMDHAAMSMAHTSGTIDSLTTGEVARRGNTARATPRRRPARTTPPVRNRSAATAEACRHSTPILRSMGLQPHADCR